jgi:acyl-CoA thioesterase I
MKLSAGLAWTLLLALPAAVAGAAESGAADPRVWRVICIGDSITQGGRRDRPEHTYRLPLQQALHALGIPFDFIGSRRAGLHADAVWPEIVAGVAFDPEHEGYYGAKTARVRDLVLPRLPELPPPDLALIHLGTNDQKAADLDAAVIAPLEELVAGLRARNPRVAVVFGHLNFPDLAVAIDLRGRVEALAARISRAESPVVTAQCHRGWRPNPKEAGTYTFDWAHPNPSGQRRLAAVWLEAALPFLLQTP